MGLIKGFLFLSGVPVRPSTTRERSRRYQRQTNQILSDMAYGNDAGSNQGGEINIFVSDSRSHKKCPDCAEFIQAEARKCRYCSRVFSQEEINELQMQALQNENSTEVVQDSPPKLIDFRGREKVERIASQLASKLKDATENRNLITEPTAAEISAHTHSECSSCGEMILKSAKICRHCQKPQPSA